MRKIGIVETAEDLWLDKKVETYELYLAGSHRDYESIVETRGHEEALRSPHARGIAQYSHVVDVLRDLLDSSDPGKYKKALLEQSRQAVSVLRDANAPDWRRLAVAAILEVLADVPG